MHVTKNVHALKIPFKIPVSPDRSIDRFVYVSIIYGERIWLIDTGVAASADSIYASIRQNGRSPDEIAGIVLTHSHPDHIGAAKFIREKTGCLVAAHGAEKKWIEDVDLQVRQRPVPGFHALVGGSVRVDRVLADDDIFDLGDEQQLQVIHTPGHSAGSISLFLRGEGIVFCGDAVPVKNELPIYEDAAASFASVEKLKQMGLLPSEWVEINMKN